MKSLYYNITRRAFPAMLALVLLVQACKVDRIEDPNNPSIGSIIQNASLGEIQNLVDGIESSIRLNLNNYFDGVGVVGREFYRFSTSDPRFTSDLLGKGNAVLDNNTFYTTNPFAARYRTVKNTNILMQALGNTKAAMSEAQRKAGIAYAKTMQAYELLMVLNQQYNNGIRVDVSDPDNLGTFLSRDESYSAVLALLDAANADLSGNAVEFPFSSSIYSDEAATFSKFNRALAARVNVYKKDWNAALTALTGSFFDLNGDLNEGAYYLFSTAGGDQLNPLFVPLNSPPAETRVAHPTFVSQAEAGDDRLSKVSIRTSTATQDALSSNYDFYVYKTNADKIPIIRNEELILIYAEAKAQLGGANLTDAQTALNKIRNAASLSNTTAATQAQLIDEMLKQRRYSLFGEGHRWIDMRRYDRLAQLPVDRAGDDVWVEFPRPADEQ